MLVDDTGHRKARCSVGLSNVELRGAHAASTRRNPRLANHRRLCGSSLPADLSVQSIIVRAVTPDYAEGLQYHVLPSDDPLRALNILREAAGLPPLSDEHDDEGG